MRDECLVQLWLRLSARLEEWDSNWRVRTGLDRKRRIRSLNDSEPITDEEAFEAFTLAILSGNTRWDRIAKVRYRLCEQFQGFDPRAFAVVEDSEIDRIVRWFRDHQAGAARLGDSLSRLRQTAALLAGRGRFASANELIQAAFAQAGGSPERVALLLGTSKNWKLPGFGIALAAEGLRNLRFDLSKPDRHVLRAVGSWGMVRFAKWDRKGPFTPPQASAKELLSSMLAMRHLAEANGILITQANSVVWTAGAVSGARLTNEQLAELRP